MTRSSIGFVLTEHETPGVQSPQGGHGERATSPSNAARAAAARTREIRLTLAAANSTHPREIIQIVGAVLL